MSVFGVVLVRIQSQCGKMRTRITPNTDTFPVRGVTTDDLKHHLAPLLKKKPEHIILHIATNDDFSKKSGQILDELLQMKQSQIYYQLAKWLCLDQRFGLIMARYPSLHKKPSFPLRISSVNVSKSGQILSHLLKKSLMANFIFLCSV